jgi:outer membrane biosynthesis protein TonB
MKLIWGRLTGLGKASALLLLCLSSVIALAACGGEQTSPAVAATVAATPTATAAPAATPEPTAGSPPAATQAPGDTPTPTPTLAPTAAPEPTATPVPTVTPAPTPSPTPQPPATQAPTSTPTATPSPTPFPTPTSEPTPAPAPTTTPTPEPTATPTAPTPTATPMPTATRLPSPPDSLGLDPFYEQYLDVEGLPIVASATVAAAAMLRAKDITDEMLALRSDLLHTMTSHGTRIAVMSHSQFLTDLPEFRDLDMHPDGISWDERTRGGGVGPTSTRPVTVIAEGNLLCYEDDVFPYEDVFVHEFAHAILSMGVQRQTGGSEYRRRLEEAYQEAMDRGLWEGTYAGENPDEYWAEGVQSWFGLNDPPGRIHNDINTRTELESYDPILAGLIREVFGDSEVASSCHDTEDRNYEYYEFSIEGVIAGPDGGPLEGIGLWAWQSRRSNSGSGRTGPQGGFNIRVPEGSFTLDIYADSPGGCIGWFDGKGGITTRRTERARVLVDGANVSGIEILLRKLPADLPRIQC